MSVEIDPLELSFRRPFTVEVGRFLKIKNPNPHPVAFKVKTTAPKQYCVRPNSGRIEPGHEVEVTVLLQAMKAEPPADAKCRDKFLVQSINIPGDKEFTNVQDVWDTVDKGSVQEKKIRVNWLGATEDGQQVPAAAATPGRQTHTNGVEATPEPPAYSSPENTRDFASTPAQESKTEAKTITEQGSTALATAVENVKPTVEATYEELKAQLAKAQAKITELSNEAASGILRQRNTGAAAGTKEKSTEQPVQQLAQAVRQGTEGVPIRLVAVLCLVSFLLAYFFF